MQRSIDQFPELYFRQQKFFVFVFRLVAIDFSQLQSYRCEIIS